MTPTDAISLTANLATIISSFSIVFAIYVYVRDKMHENKKLDFSDSKDRAKFFSTLAKNPSLIDKVVIDKGRMKGSSFGEAIMERYKLSAYGDRESLLRDGLRFIFSDEAIKGAGSLDSSIYNNLEVVISRFCSLAVDSENFYTPNCKKIEAWIELDNIKKFIIQFPIPDHMYDENIFSEIRFGKKTISGFGSEIINQYFLPYLILYISKNYSSISKDDAYRVLSVLWEVGPA